MALRAAQDWFSAYGESHQNPVNKRIHFVCVPLIMFSLLGLLWAIPLPETVARATSPHLIPMIFIGACLGFYLRISVSLALGMMVETVLMVAALVGLERGLGLNRAELALLMGGIFLLSWVFQLIGHKIEGKKPSFTDDLKFLLVGPLWILGFLYRRLGISY